MVGNKTIMEGPKNRACKNGMEGKGVCGVRFTLGAPMPDGVTAESSPGKLTRHHLQPLH